MTIATMMAPVVLLLLISLAPGHQQRDVQRPVAVTLTLSGMVLTDGETVAPIRGAEVRMHVASDPRTMRSTTTDAAGRFQFAGLSPGNITLTVSKPGYVTTAYGAKRPGTTVGVPIALVEGKQVEPVTVRIPRGGVITGMVLDRIGRPMRGVAVRLQRVTATASGERVVRPFNPVSPTATSSDDRGIYRIYGLPAGEYLVFVQPRVPGPLLAQVDGRSVLVGDDVRLTTTEELQWAERAIARGQRGAAPTGAVPQLAAPPAAKTAAYANVFYPGTADPSGAALVSLQAGQERTGIDIAVQFVPTATISGVVRDANGQAPKGLSITIMPRGGGATLELERELMLMGLGMASGRGVARTSTDGSFTVRAVPPGGYVLAARTADQAWASTEISVDGRDLDGVSLTVSPAMTVEGRLVFESGTGAPPPRFTLRLAPLGTGVVPGVTAVIDAGTGTFSISGVVPGEYRVTATVPTAGRVPWTVATAMLDGRDVIDVPFTVSAGQNVTGLTVTFTDAAAELSGMLFDAAGRPTSDLSVMVLAVDPSRWFRGSRYVRAPMRPSSDGRFTFTGLAPGDYFLAALSDFEPGDQFDPLFLEQLAASGIRVSVAAGRKQTQDVRIR